MPIGEFRAWARLKLANIIGNEEFLDDAQRRMDEYHSGQLRRGERCFAYRMSQLEGFYHYNALPMLPAGMPEEEAFYNIPKDKCKWAFYDIDKNLFQASHRDRRNCRQFHTRMQSCNRHWEVFMKCVVGRDIRILRNIESWERYNLKRMKDDTERQAYVDAVRVKSEYYDYMYKITDPDKKISCYYEKRQKEHKRRLYNLLDTFDDIRGIPRDQTRPHLKKASDVNKGHYVITHNQ